MPSRPALKTPAAGKKTPAKRRAKTEALQPGSQRQIDHQSEISRLSHEVLLLTQMNDKLKSANEQLRLEIAGLGRLLSEPVTGSTASLGTLRSLGKKIEREVRRVRNQILGRKKK